MYVSENDFPTFESYVVFARSSPHRLMIPFDQIAARTGEFPHLIVDVQLDRDTVTTAPRLLFDGKLASCSFQAEVQHYRWECEPDPSIQTIEYQWDDGKSSRLSVTMNELVCTGRATECAE